MAKSGALDGEVLKGLLDTLVLHALRDGDDYGFGLLQKLGKNLEREDGVLKERTLYPLLHRLESKAFVESYFQPGNRGTPRKYYRITAAGLEQLKLRTRQWSRVRTLLERTVLATSLLAVARQAPPAPLTQEEQHG